MSLAPLLAATPAIQLHALAAIAALVLGTVQLLGPKGTLPHRVVGYIWVGLMVVIAVSSFWITGFDHFAGFSLIHLISVYVLVVIPFGVLAARRGDVKRHRGDMINLFAGALLIAGALTLLPGRLMFKTLFGG